MNPEHAKAFNELKELCEKYKMFIDISEGAIQFCFDKIPCYESVQFGASCDWVTTVPPPLEYRTKILRIPPPETKGDKNE